MARIADSISITRSTPEKKVLEFGKECRKCGHCCTYGSGFVLPTEVAGIADSLGISKEELKKGYLEEVEVFATKMFKFRTVKAGKPYGACILMDKDNSCKIHGTKPLHCRIGNCNEYGEQLSIWFMLNHAVNPSDPRSIREWSYYLGSHPTIPGGTLDDLVPDKEKLKKMLEQKEVSEK